MLKKWLVLIISVFLFSGCTKNSEIEEINFSSWGSITEVKILKKIISDFEHENPNIRINFIHIPQNYFQKLHLLFVSNSAPDVLFINNLYLPIYENHLEDLSCIIDKKSFYEQAINGLSLNGKVLAIPRDISNLVFYINSDKISFLKENFTLDDLIKSAKFATNNNLWGIGLENDIYWIQPYLAYFGEEVNEEFDTETSKGLCFYKELQKVYKIAPSESQIGSSTLAQMFLDEKIAIYLSGRWMYPKISEKAQFNWKIVAFPLGQKPLPCDVSGWAISKQSQHKDSAIKFVQYLANNKSSKYFTETGLIVPARKDSSFLINNKEHNEKVFLEVLASSKNTYVGKNYKKLTDKINFEIMNK